MKTVRKHTFPTYMQITNASNFRETLEDILFNTDAYTKDELFTAFQEMTERYLKHLTEGMDEDELEEFYANVNAENPSIADLDLTNAKEKDKNKVIQNLLDYVGFEIRSKD